VTLDRIDLVGDTAEHGGAVAGASPDLQHPIAGLCFGGLDHQRDDVGLRDGLPLLDGQRVVLVGELLEAARHERLARNLAHGVEHASIGHAAAGDLPLHHAVAVDRMVVELSGVLGHGRPFRPLCPSNVVVALGFPITRSPGPPPTERR
jgi:hypothetical protein